jgi:hypothetical protein
MANPAIEKLIESLDNDLPRSALFQKKVPALAEAFDADRMKPILQEALCGSVNGGYSIIECTPGKALYSLDHVINMQYKLKILDPTNNQMMVTLFNARLFQDLGECKTYLDQMLRPIAARMHDRQSSRLPDRCDHRASEYGPFRLPH